MSRPDWERMREAVLRRIRPSEATTRRALAAAERLAKRAQAEAGRRGLAIRPVVVGSLAKDTHLKPAPDVDLFLLFPTSTSREDLEREGVTLGQALLTRPTLRYAEHPYVHGSFGGFQFDVVPAYDVGHAEGRMSAVDRSPFHAEYVRAHLKPEQRDEVRLLKRFLKGIDGYGAETGIGGFSGYLAELLILRFGTFWKTLEALSKQRPPIALSLSDAPAELGGPLVFVDPVDPSRNAAAAVAREPLERFLRASRAFRRKPSLAFFWPKPPRAAPRVQLAKLLEGRGVLAVTLPLPKVREEARLPHLRRLVEKVARWLEGEGFRVPLRAAYVLSVRQAVLLFEHDPLLLPATFTHVGPPDTRPEHTRRFLAKWQGARDAVDLPHPVDGRWQVTVRRKVRDPLALLRRELPSLLKGMELPANARQSARVKRAAELLSDPRSRLALTQFLAPRDPWER